MEIRDQVEKSEYKRFRYNYSKESFDILTSKAKELIANFNSNSVPVAPKIMLNPIDFSDYRENFYQINSRKKRILV